MQRRNALIIELLEDVDVPLTVNMAMIVHPNTYHPDVGYLVLGDTIIVTADGSWRSAITRGRRRHGSSDSSSSGSSSSRVFAL